MMMSLPAKILNKIFDEQIFHVQKATRTTIKFSNYFLYHKVNKDIC